MTSKIPSVGLLPPMPRNEIDGKIERLDKKSTPELLELIDRQNKLLSNKRFINSLPDKGNKIKTFLNKLNHELALRDRLDKSCNLLSNLSITNSQLDKNRVANLEWDKANSKKNVVEQLDSDDDSEPDDALAIVAQSTDVKIKIIILKEEPPLITEEDIKEIKSFDKEHDKLTTVKVLDDYCEHMFDKTVNKAKPVENFKPYQTTKSNCHDPCKEMKRKKGKHWEVTAATPPPSVHGACKEISLKDSLLLMEEQNRHLKEVQAKHAAEKLSEQLGKSMGDIPQVVGGIPSEDSDNESTDNDEGSDKEVLDEEPHDGGVVFTIMN